MKKLLCLLIIAVVHTVSSQSIVESLSDYEEIISTPKKHKKLILKGTAYRFFENNEKQFLNVEELVLIDVENLILPTSFIDYPNLKSLIIGNSNKINFKENIEVISKIEKLSNLEITNSNVSCVPNEIISLNSTPLKSLILSDNRIKYLPKNIDNLKVSVIDFSKNPIKNRGLKRLVENKNIEEIFLDYCDLEIFPFYLGQVENLKLLSLTFNNIDRLESSYEGFLKLELLSLTGNPLHNGLEVDFIDNVNNLIIDFVK